MVSRRKFLLSSLALTSAFALPSIGKVSREKTIRLGIIGTGARGTGLLSLIKSLPEFSVVACCDIQPDNLNAGMLLSAKGGKGYNDYRKLLDDKSIDAVIIATPLYMHYPMAVDALAAGKHVYLEKSMTYTISQANDLVNKVKDSKRVFQVGYQYRNYALYHEVKRVIQQNWLGKITQIDCQYNRNSNWRFPVKDPALERTVNWRMYREYCGGLLSELCSHQIDAVNYFLDTHPLKATGIGGIDYWKDGRETYDNIRTIYEYPGGIKVSANSTLANAYNSYRILIQGDKATVEILRDSAYLYAETTNNPTGVVDGVSGATIAATTQGKPVELKFTKEVEHSPEPTINALQDFLSCIQNGGTPRSNVETARVSSIAIHMGNEAMDKQSFVQWKA